MRDAVHRGAALRLRPIIMTSIATRRRRAARAGAGAGAEARKAIGRVIVGGVAWRRADDPRRALAVPADRRLHPAGEPTYAELLDRLRAGHGPAHGGAPPPAPAE